MPSGGWKFSSGKYSQYLNIDLLELSLSDLWLVACLKYCFPIGWGSLLMYPYFHRCIHLSIVHCGILKIITHLGKHDQLINDSIVLCRMAFQEGFIISRISYGWSDWVWWIYCEFTNWIINLFPFPFNNPTSFYVWKLGPITSN